MKAIIYKARPGLLKRKRTQYRARIISSGRITLSTPEGYNNVKDLEDMLLELQPNLTIIHRF